MTDRNVKSELNKGLQPGKDYAYQPGNIEKGGYQPKAEGVKPKPPSGGTSISKTKK